MSKVIAISEIENLIRNGFEIDLISFELDIPLEEVKQIADKMNQEQADKNKKKAISKSTSKLAKMREKYDELRAENHSTPVAAPRILSSRQREIIEESIKIMQLITETVPVRR